MFLPINHTSPMKLISISSILLFLIKYVYAINAVEEGHDCLIKTKFKIKYDHETHYVKRYLKMC